MRSYAGLVRHEGNETLFQAVDLSLLASLRGYPLHLYAEGVRGTGKTTVLREAAQLFPWIERVRGCLYNCHPARPHCPAHRQLDREELHRLGTEWVPMPFLEISASAKLGSVVGSLDLARITAGQAEAALMPGTLAQAHRGVVLVDEINRLADTAPELADALLDVMGTRPGRLQIEEAGLPRVELAVQVTVWAAANPDEEPGPLMHIRRQLADRFDLHVTVGRPAATRQVVSVLGHDPFRSALLVAGGEGERAKGEAGRLRRELLKRAFAPIPALPPVLQERLASLYLEQQLESLRSVEAWQTTARLLARLRGRDRVDLVDIREAAPLVLSHRVEPAVLTGILESLAQGGEPMGKEAAERLGAAAGEAGPNAQVRAVQQQAGENRRGPDGRQANPPGGRQATRPIENGWLARVQGWLDSRWQSRRPTGRPLPDLPPDRWLEFRGDGNHEP